MTPRITTELSGISLQDLLMFTEACFFLVIASVLRLTIPFRWYASFFGNPNKPGTDQPSIDSDERAVAIGLAVRRGSRYLPLACKCLVQAMATKAMLKLRGIRSVVYFGVAKDDDELIAHAWIKNGESYVVGVRGMRRHKVISVFMD